MGNNGAQRCGFNQGLSGSNFYKQLKAETTAFYVTNFPESFHQKDMWAVFNRYGKVREVYIPPRRNKDGDRFGFVRLSKVNDAKAMEVRLNTILIGNQKLPVNIPRYGRGMMMQGQAEAKQMFLNRRDNTIRRGVFFAEVVRVPAMQDAAVGMN